MTKLPSYYIPSNLSEKQIEADVACYLGWCTPVQADAPFRLVDVDESVTGADKLFDRGAAIYMQFKKSEGLQPSKTPSTRKNKSKLEEVREFRREQELDDNPTLFFQLRAKAKGAEDLQHNVLLAYERPPFSRAIYVAPLVLDTQSYSAALFASTQRFLPDPFYEIEMYRIYQKRWLSLFGSIPFLRGHISIPPHERVSTHEHYYSFSVAGVDVAWHSPSVVSRDPSRLSDFMAAFFGTISNENGLTPIDRLAATVEETANRYGHEGRFAGENAVERLMHHGRWLRQTHGIRQFLLLGHSQRLDKWRTQWNTW